MDSTNKKVFSVRDVIYLITLAVSLSGVYFPMKAKVDILEKEQLEIKATLEENNLELINYKLNEIQSDFTEFSNKFDDFVASFDDYTRGRGR